MGRRWQTYANFHDLVVQTAEVRDLLPVKSLKLCLKIGFPYVCTSLPSQSPGGSVIGGRGATG
jgi:hypothetical protein